MGSVRDHAMASLLALNGLRTFEALDADIDKLEFERGHRTLKIVRKGGKAVIIPLAPRTSRALDLFMGETAKPLTGRSSASPGERGSSESVVMAGASR